jgi:Fe-S-cluster-containing dehydrogenase component
MPVPDQFGLYIDPSRCIGCRACVQACSECDTHKGLPMIHLEYLDRAYSTQTMPTVCMHCDSPTCAEVCPADAIKKGEDGVVRSALKARCLGCNNCVLACPFGVPKMNSDFDLMMKCDLCYDRTSTGKKPMCASVCPSGALFFGTREEIERARPRSAPVNQWQFGEQTITTKVRMMAPLIHPSPPAGGEGLGVRGARLDVTACMDEPSEDKLFSLDLMDLGLFEPDEEA